MRRALKWLRWIVAVVILLPLLLVATVLVGANTGPGRHLIERELAELTGGQVTMAGLSGRFPDRLRVRQLEILDKDGAWLAIEDLAIDWHPLRLVGRDAVFDRVAAERIAVARLPAATASGQTSGSQSSFGLPVGVIIMELLVGRLDLASPVAGAPASLSLNGSAQLVSLEKGELALAAQRLDGAGTYKLAGRIDPVSLNAEIAVQEPEHGLVSGIAGLPDLGALTIDAALNGPRDAARTKIAVAAGPLQAHADGTLDLVHQAADLTVTASAPAMSPRPDLSWHSVALNARVAGPFTKPEANGTLEIKALDAAGVGLLRLSAQAQGNAGQVRLHAEADGIRVPGPRPDLVEATPLTADATVQLDAPDRPVSFTVHHQLLAAEGTAHTAGAMRIDMSLTLPDLAPFAATGGVDVQGHAALKLGAAEQDGTTNVTADGRIAITGGMAPLPGLIGDAATIGVAAALHGQDIALSRLGLNGKTLTLSADGGLRNNVVDLNWRTALANLGVIAPTVAGRLDAKGHVAGPQDDLAVTADLSGELATKGMPSGPITAKLEAQHLPKSPTGQLTAEGTLDGSPLALAVGVQQDKAGALLVDVRRADWKSAHADGALTLPQGAIVPVGKLDLRMTRLEDLRSLTGQALSGSVTAALETTEQGGRQTARLQAEARNAGLAGTASIGHATLAATVADPAGKPTVDAKLAVDGVSAGGVTASGKVEAAGPQDALALRLAAVVQNLQGAPLDLTSVATINATAKETTLSALQAGWKGQTLRLLAPARIVFGNAVTVDRLRLGIDQASLEIAGRASPTLDLTVALRDVTPDLAKLVDPAISAEGALRADAKLTGTTARPAGTVRVEATGFRMRSGAGRALPPANLTASADLAGDSARIDTRLTAGRLTTVTVTGRAPIQSSGTLDLHASGSLDLALLDPVLTPGGRRARGLVTLNMGIAGSLAAPRVTGSVQLANGEVRDYGQGVRITNIVAVVQADGDTIRIARFTGRAGQGTIGLTGSVGVMAPGLPVDLRLTADHAKPLASDRLEVTLSADLSLRGEARSQLQATGTLRIHRAEIRIPEHMPASVAVLNVRETGTPPPSPQSQAAAPNVALNLTITAEREIFVRGRGLLAELGGTIHVRGTAAQPVPDGSFELIRGTMSLAGQSLTFTKGEVGFSSGKLTDPSIDFIASSSNGNVTASLEVSGTASNPKIRLFSTPELPQDEVLAWLIFKRSSSTLSPFELAQIAAALASLTGVAPGFTDPLESVRKGLGLDTLSVGGGSGKSGPTLQGGRYVAPGVFVGAKQGTNGTSTQGLVQVDITKGLKLEGTVGTGSNANPGATPDQSGGSSIGLKYQFEY